MKLAEGYSVLEEPFLDYLETIETLLDSSIKHRLPKPVSHRIACATAGFVSGYYSFAVITSEDEDVDATFRSLRGALVASLTTFYQRGDVSEQKRVKGAAQVGGFHGSCDPAQF